MSASVRPLACLMSLLGVGCFAPTGGQAGSRGPEDALSRAAFGWVQPEPSAAGELGAEPSSLPASREELRLRLVLALHRLGPDDAAVPPSSAPQEPQVVVLNSPTLASPAPALGLAAADAVGEVVVPERSPEPTPSPVMPNSSSAVALSPPPGAPALQRESPSGAEVAQAEPPPAPALPMDPMASGASPMPIAAAGQILSAPACVQGGSEPTTPAQVPCSLVVTDAPRPPGLPRAALGDVQMALNSRVLDTIRGGYGGINGLQVSFGIERSVYINGVLMTTTSLNLNGQGQPVAGGSSLALIQSGNGNGVAPELLLSSTMPGTVIQNTLNDQRIQALTVINATVNSLQLLRSLNLQTSIREGLTDSLRR